MYKDQNSLKSQYISSEPALFLANQLLPLPSGDREEWLQNITGHIQNQGLKTPIVEKEHLDLAIRVCIRFMFKFTFNYI